MKIKRKLCFLCRVISSLLFVLAVGAQAAAAETAGLKVLAAAENPPLNFVKDGEITGLATEVVRELVRRTGTDEKIRPVLWREGYQMLLEQPDIALFSTVMTSERRKLFQWVGPLAVLDTNFYALKGSGIEIANLDEARKVNKIATAAKYYSEEMLEKEGFTNTQSYPDRVASVRSLLDGKAQLVAAGNTEMPAALEKNGASMDDVVNVFTLSTDMVYVAFSKKISPELVARWQDTLDEMKRDGTFAKIYAKWLPAEIPPGIFQLVTEDYPPVTFLKDGRPSGFVTDIVREIAARLGIPDNIRLTSWKKRLRHGAAPPEGAAFQCGANAGAGKPFPVGGPGGEKPRDSLREEGLGNQDQPPGRGQAACRHRNDDELVHGTVFKA